MKAARYYGRGDVRVEDVPEPGSPGTDEVQLRVGWVGICGTDLSEYVNGPKYVPTQAPHPVTGRIAPIILGHEFSGEVVGRGAAVNALEIGDWVAGHCVVPCGKCFWCLRHEYTICERVSFLGLNTDGALAEYVNVPIGTCLRLPSGQPHDLAALAEPSAVAVRGVRKARLRPGETVAVLGLGPIGLLAVQVARAAGAGFVIAVGRGEQRKQLARVFGANIVLDSAGPELLRARIAEHTSGRGADAVIECAGRPESLQIASEVTRRGGRVVLLGIVTGESRLHTFETVLEEKQFLGSNAYVHDEDFAAAVAMAGDGRLNLAPMVTSRIELANVVEGGLEALRNDKQHQVKILVSPRVATTG